MKVLQELTRTYKILKHFHMVYVLFWDFEKQEL